MGKSKIGILGLVWLLAFASCVNLKHVGDFSASAMKGLASFESLGYGFEKSCLDNCHEQSIQKLDLNPNCPCQQEAKADSATFVIYQALSAYLDGLNRLSANETARYNSKALTDQVSSGSFGSITFSPEQATAYINIGNIVGNAISNGYRQNKIRQYVTAADPSFQELIRFLEFTLSRNLKGILRNQTSMSQVSYFQLYRDPSLSAFEKRQVANAYFDRKRLLEKYGKEIDLYVQMLAKIGTGHRELAENIDQWSLADVKSQLSALAGDLEQLYGYYNKLKP
jgi:hypothetical protein